MKMVIAVVHDEDSFELIDTLNERNYRVTKLATTGGFLKSGNTTIMVGVKKEQTNEVIDIIKGICKSREEVLVSPTPGSFTSDTGVYMQYPIKVNVGGATIFVIDVDEFIRI